MKDLESKLGIVAPCFDRLRELPARDRKLPQKVAGLVSLDVLTFKKSLPLREQVGVEEDESGAIDNVCAVLVSTEPPTESPADVISWRRTVRTNFETWIARKEVKEQVRPEINTRAGDDAKVEQLPKTLEATLPKDYLKALQLHQRAAGQKFADRTLGDLLLRALARAKDGRHYVE